MDQKPPRLRSLLAAALLCAGALGCTASPFQLPSPRGPSGSPPAPPPGAAREPERSTASAALLERSRDERAAGRYPEAASTLERALRIDPNDPLLWVELAEVKAATGDRRQAEELARKALTLAGGDRSIESRARRLL